MIDDSKVFKKQKIYINLLIGLGLITIPIISSPDIESGFGLFKVAPFQRNFLSYLLLTIFFFGSYYYIVPKFYITKRWVLFFLMTLIGYFIVIKIPEYTISNKVIFDLNESQHKHLIDYPKHNHPYLQMFLSRDNHILQFLGVFILSIFLRVNEHLNKVRYDKLLTEISYLRSQINPHFLFNTLNSLYALVLTKSDEAPNALLKLSDLVRYVVSESNKSTVSLEKEINYIKNFIDLQQLRLTEKTKVVFNFKDDFRNEQITPLLLISIIENAFKYGTDVDNNSEIILNLSINNSVLSLDVENTIVAQKKQVSTENGIINTKKQLTVFYPNKHTLTINNDTKRYKVNLEINLR